MTGEHLIREARVPVTVVHTHCVSVRRVRVALEGRDVKKKARYTAEGIKCNLGARRGRWSEEVANQRANMIEELKVRGRNGEVLSCEKKNTVPRSTIVGHCESKVPRMYARSRTVSSINGELRFHGRRTRFSPGTRDNVRGIQPTPTSGHFLVDLRLIPDARHPTGVNSQSRVTVAH